MKDRDALARVGAVVEMGHAIAGAEGLDHPLQRVQDARRDPCHRRGAEQAVGVKRALAVALGQREAPLGRGRRGLIDREDPGDGLLLEPPPAVAPVGAGARVELARAGLADARGNTPF
jgi:hypothetical protein